MGSETTVFLGKFRTSSSEYKSNTIWCEVKDSYKISEHTVRSLNRFKLVLFHHKICNSLLEDLASDWAAVLYSKAAVRTQWEDSEEHIEMRETDTRALPHMLLTHIRDIIQTLPLCESLEGAAVVCTYCMSGL